MGYSSSFASTVKMRTLLAFAVALASTTAFELTRTNNGGTDQVFILTSAHDDSYADNSNIYNSFGNDGYANTGNDNNGDYGGHYSHSYDDDSAEDTGYVIVDSGYSTGISSQLRAKLRDWAVRPV